MAVVGLCLGRGAMWGTFQDSKLGTKIIVYDVVVSIKQLLFSSNNEESTTVSLPQFTCLPALSLLLFMPPIINLSSYSFIKFYIYHNTIYNNQHRARCTHVVPIEWDTFALSKGMGFGRCRQSLSHNTFPTKIHFSTFFTHSPPQTSKPSSFRPAFTYSIPTFQLLNHTIWHNKATSFLITCTSVNITIL